MSHPTPATGKLELSCAIITMTVIPVPGVGKESEVVKLPERRWFSLGFYRVRQPGSFLWRGMLQTH